MTLLLLYLSAQPSQHRNLNTPKRSGLNCRFDNQGQIDYSKAWLSGSAPFGPRRTEARTTSQGPGRRLKPSALDGFTVVFCYGTNLKKLQKVPGTPKVLNPSKKASKIYQTGSANEPKGVPQKGPKNGGPRPTNSLPKANGRAAASYCAPANGNIPRSTGASAGHRRGFEIYFSDKKGI